MTSYLIVIERTATGFGAFAPDLPGVGVVGDTREETERLMREAIAFHLEALREDGLPVPPAQSYAITVEVAA